jgi:multicomponent Na+:H+ antiporter subunit A
MLYAAALQAGWAVPAMVAWVVSLGTVFLCAKATSAVFLGPTTEKTKDAHEATPTMVWGMGFMAAGSLVLGVAPQLAVNYFLNPILSVLGLGEGVQVTWFGLFANAGSFSTTGGLVLALVSLVLGGLIYAIAYVARPAQVTGGALAGSGVPTDGSLSVGWRTGLYRPAPSAPFASGLSFPMTRHPFVGAFRSVL